MKMTALSLESFRLLNRILRERELLTEDTSEEVITKLRRGLNRFFMECDKKTPELLQKERYERFRKF